MFTKYITPKKRHLSPLSHKGYIPTGVTGEPRFLPPSQQQEAEGGRNSTKVGRGTGSLSQVLETMSNRVTYLPV